MKGKFIEVSKYVACEGELQLVYIVVIKSVYDFYIYP
jgi:hypothetical protein